MNNFTKNYRRFVGKAFYFMKISALPLFLLGWLASVSAAHPVLSQDLLARRISIKAEKTPLKEVLRQLNRQTDIRFSYNSKQIDVEVPVSLVSANEPLGQVLDRLLTPLGIGYTVYSRLVVLKLQDPQKNTTEIDADKTDKAAVPFPAELTVSGRVTDEKGDALPGVSILVKGTQRGIVTDINGNFSIDVPDADAVLVFSFVGYITRETAVANQVKLDIVLEVDEKALDEIVVVGYGTVKKSDLTGSVGSLKDKDFNQGVVTTVQQLMQGKMAGVQVVQNDGKPGGGISVSVRGVGSINSGTGPLYVIDGLPSENINFINPSDIESIEVLKDASATAIYGARGANGVVLLTTKKGAAGKLQVSYNAYAGVQNVIRRLGVLGAEDYQRTVNDLISAGGGAESERVTGIQEGGTDWQGMVYNQNAVIQSHNLSLSGGTGKTRYFVGFNLFDQDGVVKNTAFRRYSTRVNLEHKTDEKFVMGLNLSASYIRDRNIPSGFAINESGGVLYAAYNYDPTVAAYKEDGTYNLSPFMTMDNPMALVYGKNTYIDRFKTFGTFFAEYFLLPELSFKVNIGGDINTHMTDSYVDRTTIEGRANDGVGSFNRSTNTNYLAEGLLNFNRTAGIHGLNAVLGVTTQRFSSADVSGTGRGFPSDITRTYNFGSATPTLYTMGSSEEANKLLSYLGRVNYSLLDKYLLTASFRVDGSSRFGANNRFGYFPSFAAAWKMENEEFFQPLTDVVNTLKLRASWGRTGNQEISNYEALTTFGNGPVSVFDDRQVKTFQPTRIGNPNLKWETTEQTNIGIDYGLIGNRIQGTIDYYKKVTFDMLMNMPIPTTTGYAFQRQNVGKIQNSGWEFGITSHNLKTQLLDWTTQVTFNTLKNVVLDLGGAPQIITGSAGFSNQIAIIREGAPLRSFYGYQVEGIWQEGDDLSQTKDNVAPGDFRYKDVDGNGMVNADDRQILGNSFPDMIWSVGNTLSLGNFSLYVFFEGQNGVSMFNGNMAETYFPISLRRNRLAEPLLNRWTPQNPSSVYPSFVNPMGQGQKSVNSATVEDASYARLNTMKLSYRLPFKGRIFSAGTVFVTGQNLYTWTRYKGIDPAVNPNGGTNLRIDFNVYPLARTFMAGFNLQL